MFAYLIFNNFLIFFGKILFLHVLGKLLYVIILFTHFFTYLIYVYIYTYIHTNIILYVYVHVEYLPEEKTLSLNWLKVEKQLIFIQFRWVQTETL